MKNLPNKVKLLITTLILTFIALLILGYKNFHSYIDFQFYDVAFFILLAIFAESFNVAYNNSISISTGFAFTLASVILFNPFYATLIVCSGTMLRFINNNGKYIHVLNTPIYKTIFNITNLGVSILLSSFIFRFMGLETNIVSNITNLHYVLGVALFTIVFLLINSFIISKLLQYLTNDSFQKSYLPTLKFGLLNIVAMAPFGVTLAIVFKSFGFIGVFLLVFPILLARYTFLLYLQVKNKYIVTVQALMHAIEARDKYTEGHSRRVADIVELISKELKYRESHVEQLKIASLLHDVGKIGVDNNILNKPGKLTNEEYSKIKEHPEIGYNILKDINELKDISIIVRHHHERYDGLGYPLGKNYEDLDLDVFIVQLADSIDAMATDRPYRAALSEADIIEELLRNRGTQFHPKVVDAYLNAIRVNNI